MEQLTWLKNIHTYISTTVQVIFITIQTLVHTLVKSIRLATLLVLQLVKKTQNGKIGYVAAFPIPECIRGINAFTLGVQSVNPNATVEVVWTRTWFDPAVEKQAALELLNRGCDLLEQHQDTTAPQIAAQEKGALAIGYNVPTPNAAPKAYLTAPLFNWPVFYTANVQALLDGKWEGKAYWEGIDQGWVGLDALSALCVPGTQEAVDVAMEAMKAKTFEPFTGPLFDQDGTEKIPSGVPRVPGTTFPFSSLALSRVLTLVVPTARTGLPSSFAILIFSLVSSVTVQYSVCIL